MLIPSWGIPALFYLILIPVSLFKKEYKKSLLYLLFVGLFIAIPVKVMFIYYNVILHALLIALFTFLFFKTEKSALNKYFRAFVFLIGSINIALLFTSDVAVVTHLGVAYDRKYYDEEALTWNHFNKTDSIEGGFAAEINSTFSCRSNRMRNYTPAVVIAKMQTDKSYYTLTDDGLLEHELYHFKITELTARKLRKALENYHFASYEEIRKVQESYRDTLHETQKAYDTETNHNLNSPEQKRWKQKVDEELSLY
jgi:hypothetical protein